MRKINQQKKINFDFDINNGKYMYYWVKDYMLCTLEVVQKLDLKLNGKEIYDIGIGRGRALPLYKTWGIKKVIGIDINKNETRFALRKAKKLGINLKIIIDSEDNFKLKKIPCQSIEVVALMNILQMLSSNSQKTIAIEIKRILKQGGIAIIVDIQKPSLMWFFSLIAGRKMNYLSYKEFMRLFSGLTLVGYGESNYFYGVNKIMDFFLKITGKSFFEFILNKLNLLCKLIGIPATAKIFIFQK